MNKLRLLVALVAFLLLTAGAALALWSGYVPLEPAELGPRYPVVRDGEMKTGSPSLRLPVGIGGAKAESVTESEVVIRGSGRQGRSWSLRTGLGMPMTFFHADVDRNGIPDLLITFATGGCGAVPSSHLISLLFDASGLPVPFECDGYLQDVPGISDLFDMDHDGKAVLVAMHQTSGVDGYWAWTLYKAENARWRRLDGPRGKRRFPLFTHWKKFGPPSRKVVTPPRGTQDLVPDLANARPFLQGATLVSYKMDRDGELVLRLRDARGRLRTCHPARWYSSYSLVLDTHQERQIVQGSASRQSQLDILRAMQTSRGVLELYGRRPLESPERERGVLSPELIWARSRDAKDQGSVH